MRRIVCGLLALAAPSLAQAETVAPASRHDLVGTIWRWTGPAQEDPLDPLYRSRYSLELRPGGRYQLRADCNQGAGSYALNGARLSLEAGPMTLVACGPDSQADAFLREIGDVIGYSIEDGRLQLRRAASSTPMRFEARRRFTLPGTAWVLRSYNDGSEAVVSVAAGTSIRLVFSTEGRLTGSAGCNDFFATYESGAGNLSIGATGLTRKTCPEPEGIMAQEAAFLAALESAATYQSRAERLQLRTGKGALAVDLVSAVTGKLSTRQRIALPPDARVVVRIEDVSRADVRAPVIGEQSFSTGGRQVPLAFEVPFDPADIDPRHSYAIAARIADADGVLLFVTTTAHLVITRNGPTQGIEVTLDAAERDGPQSGSP